MNTSTYRYKALLAIQMDGTIVLVDDRTTYDDNNRFQGLDDLLREYGPDCLGQAEDHSINDSGAIITADVVVTWTKSEDNANGPGEWDFDLNIERVVKVNI